jgi:hypothetical protein
MLFLTRIKAPKNCTNAFLCLTQLGAIITFTSPVHAQACDGFRIEVTKQRLNNIAATVGIPLNEVPGRFESFALETIVPFPIQRNTDPFYSPARESATGGQFKNVVPDGLLPLIVIRSLVDVRLYERSVFYEAKAVSNTHLPPSEGSDPYQILGFIDAARRSTPAGQAGGQEQYEIPAVVFMTTADVKPLSMETRQIGYEAGVGVFHSIVCEPVFSFVRGKLQLGPAQLMNPDVYLGTGVSPVGVGPGREAELKDFQP